MAQNSHFWACFEATFGPLFEANLESQKRSKWGHFGAQNRSFWTLDLHRLEPL